MAATTETLDTETRHGITTSLLPASYLYHPEHYAREQELIFERSWMHKRYSPQTHKPDRQSSRESSNGQLVSSSQPSSVTTTCCSSLTPSVSPTAPM